MKTWETYKEHVKRDDPIIAEDIIEIEEVSIVNVMIEKRNALGLSQRALAYKCGIPQSSVARIETHKTTPNLDTLLKILKQLGLSLTVSSKSVRA